VKTWEGGNEREPAREVGVGVRGDEVMAFQRSPAKQVSQGTGKSDNESAECKAGIQVVDEGGWSGGVVGGSEVHVGVDFAGLRGSEVGGGEGRG
jgi:hypothetical protein